MTNQLAGAAHEPVAKGALQLVLAKGTMLMCGFALHVILARMLGVQLYGFYGLLFSLLVWFELFMAGMNRSVSMYVATNREQVRSFQYTALKALTILGFSVMALSFLATIFLPGLFNRPGTASYFLITFIDIPLIGYFHVYDAILNGERKYNYQALSMISYHVSKLFFSVLLVTLGLSLTGALMGNLACSIVGWIVAVLFFHSYPHGSNQRSTISAFQLLKYSIPFVILPLLFNIVVYSHLWYLGAAISKTDLGIYNAALSVSLVPYVLLQGVSVALFPAIAMAVSADDEKKYTRLAKQSVRLLIIAVIPICACIAVSAPTIIKIFGPDYAAGATALSLLAAGFAFLSLQFMFNVIQLACKGFARVIAINTLSVMLEIVCCVVIVDRLGMNGAALSLIISGFTGVVFNLFTLRKQFGMLINLRSFVKVVVASGICAAILFPIGKLWILVPLIVVVFVLYVLIMNLSRELTWEEMKYWLKVVMGGEKSEVQIEIEV